jgi:hypothetical protein
MVVLCVDIGLLADTCSFSSLNTITGGCVSISCAVHYPVDLFVFVVVVANVVDFHDCPSRLHKCPHSLVDAPQPLETWYHAPS